MFQIFRDVSNFILIAGSSYVQSDMRYVVEGLLDNLTYNETDGEDDLTKWLRQEAVRWACIFGDTECQEIAKMRLEKHLEDPKNHKLSPEWREWTYCKGAMKANESVLQKLEDLSHWNRHSILSCYTIFVDYAVEHEPDEIIRIVKEYNAADSDKNKLLFVTINHLYSKDKLEQMGIDLWDYRPEAPTICDDLDGVIKRRLRQIVVQRERFMKLKDY
ncbi:uncharacterized protein LOC109611394 [Ooceraea biroi]|uniref:uncharacterized protein LOC109611394 n=1 Tax=Ooceraea biroi TaxID=2015173 RepID=UPI000F096662|nr:uncharacterized protein LOC109611394 [Ooceraea biroi]